MKDLTVSVTLRSSAPLTEVITDVDDAEVIRRGNGTAIVSLEALMEASGDARAPTIERNEMGRPEWNPAAVADTAELHRLLAEAVTELSEREQLVISLYYHEELTMQEIGAVLGVGKIAVRAEQIRQAADFAPAHRIRLPGQ